MDAPVRGLYVAEEEAMCLPGSRRDGSLTGTGRVWGQSPQGGGGHSTCYRFEGWWHWGVWVLFLFFQKQTEMTI